MRKKILLAALFIAVTCGVGSVFANDNTPHPTNRPGGGVPTPDGGGSLQKGAPIAPATLLLLGLAGGAAGIKLYRNSKSND